LREEGFDGGISIVRKYLLKKRNYQENLETIIKMKKLKYSNCEIARKLGVTEGTIRYRITRQLSVKGDGRKEKASELDRYFSVLTQWAKDYSGVYHRPAIKTLYQRLERDYHYKGKVFFNR
jgi:hypothetical protein